MKKKYDLDIHAEQKPLVLIVDDIPENLQVLGAVLYQAGYEIAMAENGIIALQMIEEMKPDLILLDIMMPDMDGYEVCGKIKKMPDKMNIPIIFLTAKHESENIVKGFKTGAVDYITKPFNSSELLARVKTHVDLQRSKEQIIAYNKELKKLLEQKDEFLGIAAHDMKNPINNILGFSNLIISDIQSLPDEVKEKKETLIEDLASIKDSSNFMLKVVTELLNTETLNSGKIAMDFAKSDVGKIVRNVIVTNLVSANAKKIKVHVNKFKGLSAEVDEDRFREIADNLVNNAIKYSPKGKNIYISLMERNFEEGHVLRFSVKDEGQGLTKDDMEKVFGRFQKLSARPTGEELSSGLGLSIVKKLVELHEGRVWVESEEGRGAEFIVEIPQRGPVRPEFSALEFALFEDCSKKTEECDKEMAKVIAEPEELNDYAKSKITDLMTLLSEEYMILWENVRKNNVVNDIRKFALDIREIGREYSLKSLESFGDELNTKAVTFDIMGLPKTLAYYPEIVQKLKDKI